MAADKRTSPLVVAVVLVFAALLAVALFLLLSPDPEVAPPSRALRELERLTFVPAGELEIEGYPAWVATWRLEEPLLFDQFEATRADFEWYLGAPPWDPEWTLPEAIWSPERADWPAYASLPRARELAALRGMRLPSAAEWIYACIGPAAQRYPWGKSRQASIANTLELRLGRPTPVGSFESGRSPFGCYDMIGNAREWVTGRLPTEEAPSWAGSPEAVRGLVFGGSFKERIRPVYDEPPAQGGRYVIQYFADLVDRDVVDVRNGFRCCAPAREYLWDRAPEWGEGGEAERRLVSIGHRFATSSAQSAAQVVELLEELSARPGAPAALGFLLAGARGS